jgi:ABC-2 type transport system ATP-binding protein
MIETPEFYGYLTPVETLMYLGRIRGMRGSFLKERIDEVIGLVKLDRWAGIKIEKFSRGMKQRLGLAQAMLHDPPILVLDEPSLGLDPRGVVEFREIIENAGKKKTVFFASHQLVEVSQICSQVALISEGKLLAFDTIAELENKYGSLEQAYLKLTGGDVE